MRGGGAGLLVVPEQAADLGGSERVLEALLRHYPGADAVALDFRSTTVPSGVRPWWDGRVRRIAPALGRRRSHLLPFYARRLRAVAPPSAELVLSLTHPGWSAAVQPAPGAAHVCCCAGLPRALYDDWRHFVREEPLPLRPALAAAIPALRRYWRRLLQLPDRLLTNSRYSAERLERELGRTAEVIYPPVRTGFFTPAADSPREHFLLVGRLVEQKRVATVIEACRGLERHLVVVGDGTSAARLRSRGHRGVRFTGHVSDGELRRLYRRSHALICPSVEDFGLVMAEAQACGTPVIAPAEGGALEIVEPGATGVLLERLDARSLRALMGAWRPETFAPARCRAAAERFSERHFTTAIDRVIDDELAGRRSGARIPSRRVRSRSNAR